MTNSPLAWVLFSLFILVMLMVDLLVVHRHPHAIRMREALGWSAFWVTLALLFTGWIYYDRGRHVALEFFTGYLIEQSLSIDNLFVFMLIFRYFSVPPQYQHRVLFWGILGALVMRLLFIVAGVALLHRFHAVIYVFGAILVYSGFKMWSQKDVEIHPEKNPVIRLFRRFMPVAPNFDGERFFTLWHERRVATPLLIVLIMVETTDLLFAVDSIPAVLAITHDPFIVYTSNVFAILGLRSLYFALAGVMQLFHYLHYGLSVILVFVGLKMLLADVYKIPTAVALGTIAGILVVSVVFSLRRPKPGEEVPPL